MWDRAINTASRQKMKRGDPLPRSHVPAYSKCFTITISLGFLWLKIQCHSSHVYLLTLTIDVHLCYCY